MKASAVLTGLGLVGLALAGPAPPAEIKVQSQAPWNLRAISHRSPPTLGSWNYLRRYEYYYSPWPSEKTYYAYVLDSGVRTSHKEFEGRATSLWSGYKVKAGFNFEDEDGHGTSVAGVIAAKTYGVAKQARIISVKILDNEGRSQLSILLEGLAFAIQDIVQKKLHNNAVINLSMGMDRSKSLNHMVDQAYKLRADNRPASILIVVPSGNEGVDAATCSPASSEKGITVGSIGTSWNVDIDSNFGSTVDILAPGDGVTSLSIASDTATSTGSGTSLAAPHVAALCLNAMAVFGKESHQVHRFLLDETPTTGKIQGKLRGAPNKLVNNNNPHGNNKKQDS